MINLNDGGQSFTEIADFIDNYKESELSEQ